MYSIVGTVERVKGGRRAERVRSNKEKGEGKGGQGGIRWGKWKMESKERNGSMRLL